MGEAVIEARSVVTQFGKNFIHQDVSFRVERGKIAALIGGSGSGKSTVLREIIGLLRPSAGKTFLFGNDIWQASQEELTAIRNRIGVLFQNGALFSALSVGENIATPLREQMDLSNALIGCVVNLRLALAGLSADTASKMPSELSGGMVKRVSLARALSLEPEVLFLDEPTSGLDPINARAFDELIRTLCDSLGLTIFMVTHDLDTLINITDQIIVLDQGHVLVDGTLKQVQAIDHPWLKEYFSSRTN